MTSRFTIISDNGPDGSATDRYAIFDTLGDWPACKTIGSGEGDERFTMLTREEAQETAERLNREATDRDKFEEGHALLSKVMEDIGEQVPYRSVIEWWLEHRHPERELAGARDGE